MPKRRGPPRKKRASALGKYLTKIRERKEKTQQEIADAIGKSRSYICKIERGQRERKTVPLKSPHEFILYQLAKAYGADIAEVLEKAKCPQLPLLYTTEEEIQVLICRLNKIRQPKNKGR
jgi:transcriptional regulator with XRE-family HTH domain